MTRVGSQRRKKKKNQCKSFGSRTQQNPTKSAFVKCHNGQLTVELITQDGGPTFIQAGSGILNLFTVLTKPPHKNKTLPSYMNINQCFNCRRVPGSSVGIATELRAGRSGIESRWGRDFPLVQTGPGAHPASCKMVTGSFTGGRGGQGVPRSWKSRAIPLPTLWATPRL